MYFIKLQIFAQSMIYGSWMLHTISSCMYEMKQNPTWITLYHISHGFFFLPMIESHSRRTKLSCFYWNRITQFALVVVCQLHAYTISIMTYWAIHWFLQKPTSQEVYENPDVCDWGEASCHLGPYYMSILQEMYIRRSVWNTRCVIEGTGVQVLG